MFKYFLKMMIIFISLPVFADNLHQWDPSLIQKGLNLKYSACYIAGSDVIILKWMTDSVLGVSSENAESDVQKNMIEKLGISINEDITLFTKSFPATFMNEKESNLCIQAIRLGKISQKSIYYALDHNGSRKGFNLKNVPERILDEIFLLSINKKLSL